MSIMPSGSESATASPPPSSGPLPHWVIELIAAIERSEDEHPRYYGDFYNGLQKLDACPQSQFLEYVPLSVRATARRWAGI